MDNVTENYQWQEGQEEHGSRATTDMNLAK